MKTIPDKIFQERLNYEKVEGGYIGQLVNMPSVIVQAETLEQLEKEAKISMKVMLEILTEGYNQPFELKEKTIL